MNQREADLIEQMTQIGLRLAELTAENKILKSVNDRLLQALPIHGVVRGGDFESKSVSRDQVISKKETSELTPNTPTEPLGNEGSAKTVHGGHDPEVVKRMWQDESKYGNRAFE